MSNNEHATSTIVLRVTPSRKAAYVRAARPGTLSAFMLGAADEKAANAKPGQPVKVEIGSGPGGDLFAIRDETGRCFLTVDNDDIQGGGPFPDVEIPTAVFNALVRHIEESRPREVEWQCHACKQVVKTIRREHQTVVDAKVMCVHRHATDCPANKPRT